MGRPRPGRRTALLLCALALQAGCNSTGTSPLNAVAYNAIVRHDYEVALTYADLAIWLAPERWEAYAARSMALLGLGRPFEAVESARTAERLGNGEPYPQYVLAESLYRAGRFEELVELVGRTPPPDPEAPSTTRLVYLREQAPIAVELARSNDLPLEVLGQRAIAGEDTCRMVARPSAATQELWTVDSVAFAPGCTPTQLANRIQRYVADVCNRDDKDAHCSITWPLPGREYHWRVDYSNESAVEGFYVGNADWTVAEGMVMFTTRDRSYTAALRTEAQVLDGGTLSHATITGALPDFVWYMRGCAESSRRGRQWTLEHPCERDG